MKNKKTVVREQQECVEQTRKLRKNEENKTEIIESNKIEIRRTRIWESRLDKRNSEKKQQEKRTGEGSEADDDGTTFSILV
jgi:hypothetical protein